MEDVPEFLAGEVIFRRIPVERLGALFPFAFVPAGGLEGIGEIGIEFVTGKRGGWAEFFAAEEIEEIVAEDGKEPGFLRGSALERGAGPEGLEECFLDQIFGGSAVAEASPGVAVKGIAVALDPKVGFESGRFGFGWSGCIHIRASPRVDAREEVQLLFTVLRKATGIRKRCLYRRW